MCSRYEAVTFVPSTQSRWQKFNTTENIYMVFMSGKFFHSKPFLILNRKRRYSYCQFGTIPHEAVRIPLITKEVFFWLGQLYKIPTQHLIYITFIKSRSHHDYCSLHSFFLDPVIFLAAGRTFWYLLRLHQNTTTKFNWRQQFPQCRKENFWNLSKG